MAKVVKRTFSLTEEQAAFIDAKVAKGDYASGSEVIRTGLRSMQERDAAFERWVEREILPALREYEAHPESALPAEQVFAELEAELEEMARAERKSA